MEKKIILTQAGVLPDSPGLQTAAIQHAFDLCRENGGTVIFPEGHYRAGSLQLWSDMTLYFCSGAILEGSDDCNDYELYPIPEGVEMRSDMEMITQYYPESWDRTNYRRAMISAYGQRNIAIVGEEGAVIDGVHCYDSGGEEGYRGPHGIYLTNCENITLKGYTIRNSGNFMHQIDNCKNITMENVTALAGSDGIHMHCCRNTVIENCVFRTGDDCIAGINIENLTVRSCELNTACNLFRIGGNHILIENCRMHGPGVYPHRITVVKGRNEELPWEQGRHNTLNVMTYFACRNYPAKEPSGDIVFRNCTVENAERFLHYRADKNMLQTGTYLAELVLENVVFSGMGGPSQCEATDKVPLKVYLKNVNAAFRSGAQNTCGLFDGEDSNTEIFVENDAIFYKTPNKNERK